MRIIQPQQFWLSSEMGAVNVAFVIDDIADTFEMDALTKGLVGGTTFLGKFSTNRM